MLLGVVALLSYALWAFCGGGTLTMTGILSLVTFLPLVGVAAILALRLFAPAGACRARRAPPRWIALAVTLATLALSVLLVAQFDPPSAGFQFVEDAPWFAGLHYRMGVDGISVLFVLLTAFLMPLCIVASWKSIENRVLEYMVAFLVLETLIIGVFCALDLIALLPVLRGPADPDVPDHRHLGRPAAGLRGLQVLPLHPAGLGADAGGDPVHDRRRPAPPSIPELMTYHFDAADCRPGCGWPSSPRSR